MRQNADQSALYQVIRIAHLQATDLMRSGPMLDCATTIVAAAPRCTA
jgi:hypothetical protein